MLISSHIHNAVNRVIVKKRWQSYFKNIEILFSTKQQGTIRTDGIFYHLCIMVTIFQVASIFSATMPFFGTVQKTDENKLYI